MRIMYDTNVLLSALVLRSSVNMHALLIGGYPGNQRLLSSFVIDEINTEARLPGTKVLTPRELVNLYA